MTVDQDVARSAAADPRPGDEPAIRLTGLSKSFGDVRAVDGLDLTILRTEIVAMLGPNGAGKSTTTEMITGLVRPDAGRVEVFGAEPQQAVRTGKVGAMLQAGALLYDARTKELLQLMHGLHAHPLPIEQVIEIADLGSFLRTKTDKLSGGQAQRLRFALAIMADPELLILDEPTVGMDVETRRGFWQSMEGFAERGRTVLFATHYLEEADQIADRIVVLNNGRIVADGTGAEIKSRVVGRSITLAADGIPVDRLALLPDVVRIEAIGARVRLHTADSDKTLRELLVRHPGAHDIEVGSARLEDAFVALTESRPDHDQQESRA
jgi:ABC-2 type transport system ATP-binding protein